MSADKASPDKTSDDWAGWKEYMGSKIAKLDHQFSENQPPNAKSSVFRGVAIFVNGYTVPVASDLKKIMQQNGGLYHSYKLSSTTHVVASNLAYSKQQSMRSKGELVVRPEWVTDSLAAGRVLPEDQYLLSGRATTSGSPVKAVELSGTSRKRDAAGNIPDSSPSCDAHSTKIVVDPDPGHSAAKQSRSNPDKLIPKTTDDNFVSEFYSNSRLHFIATLAQEMKDYFRRLKSENSKLDFPLKEELKTMSVPSVPTADSDVFMPDGSFFMHIDLDCFFVSVGVRNRPNLLGKPVAICHSRGKGPSGKQGTEFSSHAEIASCSYEARDCGVKNGMHLGQARKLCPALIPIPYDFEDYRTTSQQFYEIILGYTDNIEPVSCDEMYADVGDLCREVGQPPEAIAWQIREKIVNRTGCRASVGMGPTILTARIATKRAKPNGQFQVHPDAVSQFMKDCHLGDIPGVGFATMEKLEPLGLETCADFLDCPKQRLTEVLGAKTAEKLANACVGRDNRKIDTYGGRKSISCTINYGIRLTEWSEAEKFLFDLSTEVARRMRSAQVCGKQITLQLLIRAKDAPVEAVKFLGCGHCDAATKSVDLRAPTDQLERIHSESVRLMKEINPVIMDLRGIGIAVHKLVDTSQKISGAPLTSFFEPRKSPKKQPVWGISDSTREFSTEAEVDDTVSVTLPSSINFAPPSSDLIAQFEKMARAPKVSEVDILVVEEHLKLLVRGWYVTDAELLVKSFEKFSSTATDRAWPGLALELRKLYFTLLTSV